MEKMNVLLIDDDEIYIYLTKKLIKNYNILNPIEAFTKGNDALNYLQFNSNNEQKLPELIFLDISMPVMDGWAFLNKYELILPSLIKKIQLYIVTSSISPSDKEKVKDYKHVTNFITKPFTKEKIDRVFNEYNNM